MRRRPALAVPAAALAALGLAASVASCIDYLAPEPAFCADTGCATVRASAWAHPLGIPMPVLGIAYFAAMLALSAIDRPKLRRGLAIAGAAWALLLVGLQAFAIGAWCKLCMIADPAAIAGGALVLAGAGVVRWRTTAASALAAAGLAVALAVALPHAPPPADVISPAPATLAETAAPGTVSVIEVVDFECPFCRRFAPRLAEAISRAHVPVTVTRKMFPLSMHPHAMTAALAWCCADAQGKGDAMADALFAAPTSALTPEGCEQIASQVGCDLDRYRADLPKMSERVAADTAEVRAAGVHSLPTVFIAGERVVGAAASTDQLLAMITRSAARR